MVRRPGRSGVDELLEAAGFGPSAPPVGRWSITWDPGLEVELTAPTSEHLAELREHLDGDGSVPFSVAPGRCRIVRACFEGCDVIFDPSLELPGGELRVSHELRAAIRGGVVSITLRFPAEEDEDQVDRSGSFADWQARAAALIARKQRDHR
jgi:hypothetical protein